MPACRPIEHARSDEPILTAEHNSKRCALISSAVFAGYTDATGRKASTRWSPVSPVHVSATTSAWQRDA